MGVYAIKPWFRGRLAGVTEGLVGRGVTPDQVTSAGLVAALLGGGAIVLGARLNPAWWLAVPVLAFVRIAANALDGLVAQRAGLARPAGELFNETADRVADALLLVPLLAVDGLGAALPVAAVAAAELASFVGITARAAGGPRRYDGPMGKPDRMLVLSLAAVVAVFIDDALVVWQVALWVVIGGALLTAANRYRRAHRELEAR